MKFKYLSSDFLASYNEVLEELETKQAEIDSVYHDKVTDLVNREKSRLEMLVPQNFEVGQKVKVRGSSHPQVVVGSFINFTVSIESEDAYGSQLYGPGKFLPISTSVDEEVVTCEGVLRSYVVEREPSLIESDWGHTKITTSYYEDEIEPFEEDV